MSANISVDAQKNIKRTVKAFANLLKEFPKNAEGTFVYDESTLEKIGNAGVALSALTALLDREKKFMGEIERNLISENLQKLSLFWQELPKNAMDEFTYDPEVHRKMENARIAVNEFNRLID